MLFSVIIVSYNVKHYLEQCLHSITGAAKGMTVETIVIDNHSADGSRAYLEPLFPDVRFIWQEMNTGFAKACNTGMHMATGEYILFLNPDTLLPEDCFTQLYDFFKQHKDAGAVGVYMIDGRGQYLKESKRGYPSTWASLCKLSGITKLFPGSRWLAKYYLGHLPDSETNKVDVLSGAFMAMPRTVAAATGGFDETFFMYGEDIDLSYRITKLGYFNYYFPRIYILHFKGESTSRQSPVYIRHFYKAMEIFVRKHYPVLPALLYTVCIRLIIYIKSIFSRISVAATGKPAAARRLQIVSREESWQKVLDLYKTSVDPGVQEVRLVMADGNKGWLQQIHPDDGDLLFYMGALTMKEVIHILPQLNIRGRIYFHQRGSNSIVCGSGNSHKKASTREA